MREIKFRYRVQETWEGHNEIKTYYFTLEDIESGPIWLTHQYMRVLSRDEWTSLKDAEGRDIYDADILELQGFGLDGKFQVSWDDGRASWVYTDLPRAKSDTRFGQSVLERDLFVIGNIYDNPELAR